MKSDVETLSPTRVKLTVDLPFEELAPQLDAAYKRIAAQVTVPGFRKGKVPSRVIDQRFGRALVLEEAVNEAVPAAFEKAVAENNLRPLGTPEFDVQELNDGQNLAFTVEVDVRPEFDLPDLDAFVVEVDGAEPTDEEVTEQVDALRARFATLTDVDRPAQDGDVLLVDLSGACEGEEVEDLMASALSFEVGGKEEPLPGFDDAVRGAVADDVRSFSFPAEAGQYEGKDIDVTVTVTTVRERELPAADDDFALMASEFDTMDELTDDVRTRLVRMKRLEQGVQARTKLHEQLVDSVDFPLPESLIARELEEHFHDGHGDDDHKAEFESEARGRIKSAILLDRIAEENELTVAQEELSAWLMQQAPRYGMTPDQFANELVQAGQVQMAVTEVRRAKALAFVMEKARIVDPSGAEVDLDALNADLAAAMAAGGLQGLGG
ncbi:MAG: trigger factor [Candidatus Nanopelagicales bacterium]|nr:trigger factor [Candidatus Nanopelagicales bacterium]